MMIRRMCHRKEELTFEAPSMTLDASDFSLFTQKCLEKYNLVDNVDGELKVRSGSSRSELVCHQ